MLAATTADGRAARGRSALKHHEIMPDDDLPVELRPTSSLKLVAGASAPPVYDHRYETHCSPMIT